MNTRVKDLTYLLAYLRSLQMLYQTLHWQAKGTSAYSDHLLYARLYEALGEEIDQLAEKIAGLDGDLSLSLGPQLKLVCAIESGWMSDFHATSVEIALHAEECLQRCLKKIFDQLKDSGMTLGLEDFLASLASKHEENLYLLRQRDNFNEDLTRILIRKATAKR
jgi:DNA-binding ferritin-like protein